MKKSLLYILFEGFSKGGSYLLLLFIANFFSNEMYISLMTLLSFETLLKMFFVSYYGEALYKLQNIYPKNRLFPSYIALVIVQVLLIALLIITAHSLLFHYFGHGNLLTYFAILINAILFNSFRLNSSYSQIQENHRTAIIYRSLPFFSAFAFSLLFVWLFNDKILGFFLGKSVGFFLFQLVVRRRQTFSLRLSFNKAIISDILKRSVYLFSNAWLGWVTGIGFINVAKIISKNDLQVAKMGYALNIYSILLLAGYGINQVYGPRLKKLIETNSLEAGIEFSKKIQFLFIGIVLFGSLSFIGLDIIFNYFSIDLSIVPNFVDFWNVVPAAIAVFFFSSFAWIANPYYYILDRYKEFFRITFWGFIASFIIAIITATKFKILIAYIILIAIKSVVIYLWILRKLFPKIGKR